MKKVLMLIIIITLYGLSAQAAILEVGAGRTYTTIQAAVDAASAGDTILVYAGVYADKVLIGDSGGTALSEDMTKYANVVLMASGTPTDKITIKSAGDGDVIIDGQSSTDFNLYGVSRKHYVLDGLKFRNARQSSIRYVGSSAENLVVKNCTFEGTTSAPYDHGIELKGDNAYIYNNTFSLPGSFVVIDVVDALNSIISHNTITGGDYGIYVHNYTHGTSVEFNNLTGNAGDLTGIFFRDANNITVRRNVINGDYSNYMIYYQDSLSISTGGRIINNTIHCGGTATGIAEPYTWADTTNNIIYNCQVGIRGIDPSALPADQPAYNIIYGANYHYYWNGTDWWPIGTGNITSDPEFILPGSDYQLKSGSPAIDAGDPSYVVPDSWGVVDIGRYEWNASGNRPDIPVEVQAK